MHLIAKTFAGCEDILSTELETLGATDTRLLTRAVAFEGDLSILYKANLHCRTALRILRPMYQFEAADEYMLYNEMNNIDWSQHFGLEHTFAVNTTLHASHLNHSLYASLKAKDAIVDQFRDRYGERPDVDTEQPDFRVHLHISENLCTVSFDSSGESLHKRGYRDYTNQAPINEALAAALVLQSGWDKTMPLADFMCGSGTILIEAAFIALNIAPNKFRTRFGFETWNDFDSALWKQIKEEALRNELPPDNLQLYGTDISGTVLDKAKQNIAAAGLSTCIRLKKCSFEHFKVPAETGMLISNPPYGLRLEPRDIMEMYQHMGDKMKKDFRGWTCWIFTGNLDVAKFIGLKPSRKIKLYNGPIECRFLKFAIYEGSKKLKKQLPLAE